MERRKEARWTLFNPDPFFGALAPIFCRLRPVAPVFIAALAIGLPVSLYLFFTSGDAVRHDLHRFRGGISYFGMLLVHLLTVNLLRCIVQGIVCAGYRTPVPEFGIRLRFGILPRFYIDKRAVRNLGRRAKMWIYAASPLLRLVLITVGMLLWALFRDTGSALASIGAWAAHAGLIGLLFVSIPLWKSDGYNWLAALLGLHPRFREHSLRTLFHALLRRPLPAEVPASRRHLYMACGLAFAVGWTFLLVKICAAIVRGLEQSFPRVGGYSTHWVFLGLVAGLMGVWAAKKLRHAKQNHPEGEPIDGRDGDSEPPELRVNLPTKP
jgi:hypothetical protein